jgi:hypothetical protein
MYEEPEFRKEMREKGLKRAAFFNWDTAAEAIYCEFRRVLEH